MAEEEHIPYVVEELPEGAQMVPDEVKQELERTEREAMEKVLDRVAEDPAFRQKLLDDPDGALQDIGLEGEFDIHMAGQGELSEVAGQSRWWSYWYGPHKHWWGHWRCRRWHYHHYL
jgi:hypothetical protein